MVSAAGAAVRPCCTDALRIKAGDRRTLARWGLDVELIQVMATGSRRYQEVQLAVVGDWPGHFADVVGRVQHGGRTPMLSRLDLYGTCELTAAEMEQLLNEFAELDAAVDAREERVVAAVRGLAERCRDG